MVRTRPCPHLCVWTKNLALCLLHSFPTRDSSRKPKTQRQWFPGCGYTEQVEGLLKVPESPEYDFSKNKLKIKKNDQSVLELIEVVDTQF